jgi:mannitol-1-/sugar-/sorbitol-6-phosphatase
MPIFHCSAILFDLDGVLIDSTPSVSRQWRVWAKENGIDPQKLLTFAHGRRTADTVRAVAPHLDAEEETRKLELRESNDTEGVSVMPGAIDLLRAVPSGRWCVVTSGTRVLATARLKLGKIPFPQVLVTADDVAAGKPDPAPYLMGARLLGMKPEDCLVIEDAPAGIEAAHAGGMKVIALPSTYPKEALQTADAVVGELSQIRVSVGDEKLRVDVR